MLRREQGSDERGHSLLEVFVVLGVVTMMALVAGEGFRSIIMANQQTVVRSAIAEELRIARHRAVMRRETIHVIFDGPGKRIRMESSLSPGVPMRQYDFSKSGVRLNSLSNGPVVKFYPSGRAATPTTIRLDNARGQQLMLTVSMTGRVSFR